MNNRRGRRRRDIAGGGMPAIEDFEELPLLQRFARNANDTEGPSRKKRRKNNNKIGKFF